MLALQGAMVAQGQGEGRVTVIEAFYMGLVAKLGCVVCRRFEPTGLPVEVHHVARGSGVRSDFAVAPLCVEHHRGQAGFHGMGERAFCRLYRPPGEAETGLLIWNAEDLARYLRAARVVA